MRRWFSAQPIHRKLVITSMAKTTTVLFAAMVTLLVLDAWRFQNAARADAASMAAIVAENSRAALAFQDRSAAAETLATLRLRPQVQRACVYDSDGQLLSSYARDATFACSRAVPDSTSWFVLAATAPVEHNGRVIGTVYIDRDWVTLRERLVAAGLASAVVLVLASIVMFVVSHRLHRTISEPIRQLAVAARDMGRPETFQMPPIAAAPDEVGQLVSAFGAMADRVRTVNDDLVRSNEALRAEVADRRAVEAEREVLLVREQQANRIKDEFLAVVSHELRTPLNAIVGWAQILVTATPDPATIARAAASLHRNALAQARVIDDLIDISRIVTGKLHVLSEAVDLRASVEAAVEAIRPAASHGGVILNVELPTTVCLVTGDRVRLQQIVWNLLSNAVKFAPQGRVTVALRLDGANFNLQVSDTGVGIPAEFVDHVFDRFRQADSSFTREHGGLGIGLAVVKELVELHGGSVRAASPGQGKGAVFTVQLPVLVSYVPADPPEASLPSLSGLTVLAVDDNLDSLEVLEAALTAAGATVRLASSGAEALELWERQRYDLVLCDLSMPGMSGFELLERIRELDKSAGRATPAIAVTAHATEEQVVRSARAGFQMHIAKPFAAGQLIRAINAARNSRVLRTWE